MTWVSPITWSLEDVPTKAQLDEIFTNLEHLKARPEYYLGVGDGTADFTETLTTWQDVDATFDTGSVAWKNGHILVVSMFDVSHSNSSGTNGAYLTVSVNGTDIGGTNGISVQGNQRDRGEIIRVIPISAGTYSVKLRWKVQGSGTITMLGNGFYPFFLVSQIDFAP